MKIIRRKQLDELEDALNHLYEAGQCLTNDQDGRLVKDALEELKIAMELMTDVLDPLR